MVALKAERLRLDTHEFGAADFRPVHPDQRYPYHAVHEHEGARADAGEVHQRAEHDGQDESTQAAGQA